MRVPFQKLHSEGQYLWGIIYITLVSFLTNVTQIGSSFLSCLCPVGLPSVQPSIFRVAQTLLVPCLADFFSFPVRSYQNRTIVDIHVQSEGPSTPFNIMIYCYSRTIVSYADKQAISYLVTLPFVILCFDVQSNKYGLMMLKLQHVYFKYASALISFLIKRSVPITHFLLFVRKHIILTLIIYLLFDFRTSGLSLLFVHCAYGWI